MDNLLTALLWGGLAGCFLFTFLLTSGNGKGWLRNLLATVFYWLICVDIIGIMAGVAVPIFHKTGLGWRFVAFFVVLPYLLAGLRLHWVLRTKRKRRLKVNA